MNKKIVTAFVRFIQINGDKRRPVFILREDPKEIIFFDITTKYQNKSDFIKQWYFEIKDYESTGLHQQSWIDTYRVYSLQKNKDNKIKYIGS